MINADTLQHVIAAGERRRAERRAFLRTASVAGLAVGGASLLSACGGSSGDSSTATPTPTTTVSPTPSPTASSVLADNDTVNFALNLEYLEAQFYSYAVTGAGLPAALLTGTGTQGSVTGGRQVAFADTIVAQYAREIAADEIAHVALLRSAIGSAAVAQPALNIDGGATGAFTAAARAAGIATNANGQIDNVNGTFDPYASDNNFLLGAFLFEDVGVTAYRGAGPLLNASILSDAAAGIMSVEAYHAGLIRTVLYARGQTVASLRGNAGAISDARDSLDGSTDLDQGIVDAGTANIAPLDGNGLAFARTPGQVLNIVYLNRNAVIGGGFFPNGMNGNIRTSAAS